MGAQFEHQAKLKEIDLDQLVQRLKPLLRGMQGDDRTTMEQAIARELSVRGIAERTG